MAFTNYKTIRQIGKGGMSTVYLAREAAGNHLVAIKVLKTNSTSDSAYIRRFFREARITAQLEHPHIIRVLESNFDQKDGHFYIVTEYVAGGSFRTLLQPPGSELTQKLSILHKVLLALHYAHEKGIIHRDLKPSNILLTKKLEPKLCDFGIATALWGQESRLTRTNEIMGTMDYIAPEQKESSRDVDHRADLYSMGVILYQSITGRRPQGAFPPPQKLYPAIPDPLDDLVMKCLQPHPVDRYKSARNLADALFPVIEEIKKKGIGPVFLRSLAGPGAVVDTSEHETHVGPPGGSVPVPAASPPDSPGLEPPVDIGHLLEILKGGSIAEKLAAKPKFLGVVKEEHQEGLIKWLISAEGFLKETLIEACGQLKLKKSCTHLIELLNDPYYNRMAAAAIGDIGCAEAEEKLFKLLLAHGSNSHVALLPLGKLNSIKSIDLISQYLADRHTWVRELALDALALMDGGEGSGNEKIIKHLEPVSTNDGDAGIRAKAKKILWRLKK
jgi:tRNA A-37 threonylcarbamoyl transferase component Bud32